VKKQKIDVSLNKYGIRRNHIQIQKGNVGKRAILFIVVKMDYYAVDRFHNEDIPEQGISFLLSHTDFQSLFPAQRLKKPSR